jgi:2-polyprenyl-3-methyl-5-hydroxy-6-metoxy-1,4-benzoquinol methylase
MKIVHYEDLLLAPHCEVTNLFKFCGLADTTAIVNCAVEANHRKPAFEGDPGVFRKGIADSYKQEMTPEEIAYVKEKCHVYHPQALDAEERLVAGLAKIRGSGEELTKETLKDLHVGRGSFLLKLFHNPAGDFGDEELYRDNPSYDRTDLRPWMRHFRPRSGSRILDLGCGTGASLIHYSKLGCDVVGVELVQEAIDKFHKMKPEGMKGEIYQGYAEEFDDERPYDYVLVTETLEHVADPEKVIATANRCLRVGGEVYITAPNVEDSNPIHLRAITAADLKRWLKGFIITWLRDTGGRIYCKAKKTGKPPIVVSRPFLTPQPEHMENFQEWYARNRVKHNLVTVTQYYRGLHYAQKVAVRHATKIGASHILFTECDHHQYPDDGLEVLLEADKDVIGFHTYKRGFPHNSLNMRKDHPEVSMILPRQEMKDKNAYLIPFDYVEGEDLVQKTDLISWAFTLVKMSVFEKMQEAWGNLLVSQQDLKALIQGDQQTQDRLREYIKTPLGLDPFRQWGPCPTDSFFCQYCEDLGIDRYVHFGWTIAHGDVDPGEIVVHKRLEESRRMQLRQGELTMEPLQDDWGNAYGPDIEYVPQRKVVSLEQAIAGGGNGKVSLEEIEQEHGEEHQEHRQEAQEAR